MTEDHSLHHQNNSFIARIVVGKVVRHAPFGFFLDIGEAQAGVVTVTSINDDISDGKTVFPDIGSEIKAVLLGYSGPENQPRLSIRPIDLRTVEQCESEGKSPRVPEDVPA